MEYLGQLWELHEMPRCHAGAGKHIVLFLHWRKEKATFILWEEQNLNNSALKDVVFNLLIDLPMDSTLQATQVKDEKYMDA